MELSCLARSRSPQQRQYPSCGTSLLLGRCARIYGRSDFSSTDDTHVTALRDFIRKLVADPSLRAKYRRDLQFPLERNYSEYGVFPEEISN